MLMANLYKINDKSILFIHIPKTGGSSLRKVLSKYEVKKYNIGGHPDYKQIKKIIGKDFSSIDYIFTIIRNSWDWRHSWYHYVKNTHFKFTGHRFEYEQLKNLSFNGHSKWLENIDKNLLTKSYYAGEENNLFIKSQLDYITDENGTIRVDKVLKLDSIENEFKDLMIDLGLNLKFNIHTNRSTIINYKNNYDEDSINFIEKMYNKDIQQFKFKFE